MADLLADSADLGASTGRFSGGFCGGFFCLSGGFAADFLRRIFLIEFKTSSYHRKNFTAKFPASVGRFCKPV